MSNNNKKEKFNREKCRQAIVKYYKDEINELKRTIKQLKEEKISANETIKQQQIKINELEERINLYRMVVDEPEKEIVDAMNLYKNLFKEY